METLEKGQEIQYLDYTIRNCSNNDGIILFKNNANYMYEGHLGNYSSLLQAKKAALMFFLLTRHESFARILTNRILYNTGIFHEFHILEDVCRKEGIKIPTEITKSNDGNAIILFDGQNF